MKNILVPCDFSEPALNAYQQALTIATQSGGSIHLLNVIEPPLMNDTMLMPTLNFEEEMMRDLKANAQHKFKEIIDSDKLKKVKTNYKIEYGAVSTCILNFINENENEIDLVVMGTNGASGIKEFVIGSNAERIVRKSPVPVLVVKNYFHSPIKNIVVPNELDLDHQDRLMMKIKELQAFFKAKLHIVYVNTPNNFVADTVTQKRLEAFAKRHMFVNYTITIFNHLTTAEGISAFANQVNADIIALGTHSRTGIYHLTNGSIAEDLANHSKRLIWTCSLKNEPELAK